MALIPDQELTVTQRRAAVATLVEDYAPGAPAGIQAAAVDVAMPFFRLSMETQVSDGGQSVSNPSVKTRNILFHSGATSLLAPYRVPRARVIE